MGIEMSELRDIPLVVEEAVSRLSKGLGAETIYLFGSRAENRASPSSDYDLLVVVPDSVLPRHQRDRLRPAQHGYGGVYRDQEQRL